MRIDFLISFLQNEDLIGIELAAAVFIADPLNGGVSVSFPVLRLMDVFWLYDSSIVFKF